MVNRCHPSLSSWSCLFDSRTVLCPDVPLPQHRKPVEAARVANGILKIGDVSCPMRVPARQGSWREWLLPLLPVKICTRPELVPDVAFVDIPQHVDILKGMLLDWSLGRGPHSSVM